MSHIGIYNHPSHFLLHHTACTEVEQLGRVFQTHMLQA